MTPTAPLSARRDRPFAQSTIALAAIFAILLFTPIARASDLLQNPSFESNGSYTVTPWSTYDTGAGAWTRQSGGSSPNLFATVAPPAAGSWAIMAGDSDNGAGVHYLLQDFTAPSDLNTFILSYSLFIDNAGAFGSNRQVRIDLLASGAWDNTTNILSNLFLATANSPASSYNTYTQDISTLLRPGSSYRLRFGDVHDAGHLRLGVDNVSLTGTYVLAPPPVGPGPGPIEEAPEPGSLLLMGLGLVGIGVGRKLRQRA
jgi:hypothetical protein